MKPVEQDKWLNSSSENLGILRKLEDDTMLLAMEVRKRYYLTNAY